MLLVSSITPSGRAWARKAVERSVPGVTFIDSTRTGSDTGSDIGGMFDLHGVASPDLVAGLTSMKTADALSSIVTQHAEDSDAVWFPGSVAAAVTDVQALALLVDGHVAGPLDAPAIPRLRATAAAVERGVVEMLLVCPPEESAIAQAVAEVAVATAAGVRVRGVAVCPMPRKTDGWPKSIRRSARDNVDYLRQNLFPISVQRARRGEAPSFVEAGADVRNETVVQQSDGDWIWSSTIPGLSLCTVSVGTWTIDAAYPTTHVVLEIDGRIVYHAVDSIVRRCAATEAVLSGDSVAITFAPHGEQWPNEGVA